MLIVIIMNILFIILKDIYSFEKLHLGSWRTAWSQRWAWRARPEGRCWVSWTPRTSRITWPSCELKILKRKFWYRDPICTMHSTCIWPHFFYLFVLPRRVLMVSLDWKAAAEPRVHLWVSLLFWELCTASWKYRMCSGYKIANRHPRI